MAIKTITIENFQGRHNYIDQASIPDNACASGSQNVWAPMGGLTKMPGTLINATLTASASGMTLNYLRFDNFINTASYNMYYILATGNDHNFYGSLGYTNSVTHLGYTVGTLSISGANLISATGNGTLWTANVSGFGTYKARLRAAGTNNAFSTITSVEDNTHLTLSSPVSVAVATGSSYLIQSNFEPPTSYGYSDAVLNGILTICNSNIAARQFDGTDVKINTGVPQVSYLAVHKNYMFGARTTANRSRLFWSTVRDAVTAWPTNNFIDVDLNNNGFISGIFSVGPELIIFKNTKIYKLLGEIFDASNPTYSVIGISVPFDFYHNDPFSMVMHKNKLIFVASGKIYQYIPGTYFITHLSQHIIRDLSTATTFSTTNFTNPIGAGGPFPISINDNLILGNYAAVNGRGGTGETFFIVDKNDQFWLGQEDQTNQANFAGIGGYTLGGWATPSTGSSTLPTLTLPTNSASKPYVVTVDLVGPNFTSNWNGGGTQGAINAIWISKEFNIEYGTFKWIAVYLQKQSAGNLTVKWSIDQAAQVSYSVDMTKGRGNVIRAVIPINQKGSTIQLQLSNNVVNQTFFIYGIKIYYEESQLERLL